jgi:hypothetical protein
MPDAKPESMMAVITILAAWGIGSVVFVLALAAAASVRSASRMPANGEVQMETAEQILQRLNLVDNSARRVPVGARRVGAHAH